MKTSSVVAAAIAVLGTQAFPALAAGPSRPQAHGVPAYQPQAHQPVQLSHRAGNPVPREAHGGRSQAHIFYGGPRLEQRPDPNYQNPYRPMYSLNATNPGELHPYFQTRKDGFGYPSSAPSAVYLGNGVYVIPR